jgi:tRNA threonylcarbamoyladenosine biosynthesis protein TsaE
MMGAPERELRRRRLVSSSPEQTEALGGEVAAGLRPGDVVVVAGELGAGKTTLIRGACRGLGVEGPVTSPTFTIGQRYRGRVAVSHLDLYRLTDLEEEEPELLEDYLGGDAVAFIEWPALALPRLGGRRVVEVRLEQESLDRRKIEIVPADTASSRK